MTDSDHANNRRFANPWRYCSLAVFGRRQREAQARTIRQRDAVRAAMPGGTAALFLRRHQAAFAPGLAHSSIECMGQVRFSPCRGDLVQQPSAVGTAQAPGQPSRATRIRMRRWSRRQALRSSARSASTARFPPPHHVRARSQTRGLALLECIGLHSLHAPRHAYTMQPPRRAPM